jgi:hypothetical protein
VSVRNRILAALTILFCSTTMVAQSADVGQANLDSLKGLSGVVVQVNFSSMDATVDDPNERELQESIEKRLKDARIAVFKRPLGTSDSYPTLSVGVGFMNFDIYYYEMEVNIALRQEVRVLSQSELKLIAPTWSWGGSTLAAGMGKRDFISEIIDRFICDFRKVNSNIKGALPACNRPAPLLDRPAPSAKQPTVTTELEDELLRASALNEVEEVKSLIAKGADINARDPADATPLWYAVRSGSRPVGDTRVVALLLERGANVNWSISCRLTPLMYAIQRGDLKVLELLLDHNADPNATTADGHTALMAAAILGDPEAVTLLLKKGAKVDARTRSGETAVALALANRNTIPSYSRTGANAPYISVPEDELLRQTRVKHDRVIKQLQTLSPNAPE